MANTIKASRKSPSNIAFVKYWGKLDGQLPMNSSISMTLTNCYTQMDITCDFDQKRELQVYLDDKLTPSFNPKIEKFILRVSNSFEFLNKSPSIKIHSNNSFPHSSGIASSASAFSCLSKCFDDIEYSFNGRRKDSNELSSIARLGSGSACRSILNGFYHWGRENLEYSSKLVGFDDIFNTLCDSILIVNSKSKSTSSSHGHELMNEHPFRDARIIQANSNLEKLIQAMVQGDIKEWGDIVELEALSLHSLMFTSSPSVILLEANSLAIINAVREYRCKSGVQLYFTIDAGANIHLLYFEQDAKRVYKFIQDELLIFCEDSKVIHDKVSL